MAADPPEGYASDDFLEQILSIPSYAGLAGSDGTNPSETTSLNDTVSQLAPSSLHHPPPMFPLSLSLDNGRDAVNDNGAYAVKPEREGVNSSNIGSLYPAFDHLQAHAVRHPVPHIQQAFQGQPTPNTAVTVPHPPIIRPRVRARRGQATDPHSIAERLRRERISERIKALQELVPSCNKDPITGAILARGPFRDDVYHVHPQLLSSTLSNTQLLVCGLLPSIGMLVLVTPLTILVLCYFRDLSY